MSKKTPMEIQYETIKQNHQDKILLFRLGDFYEVFHDDALETAKVLNIALTKRNNNAMCGFPHHSLEQYAYKLVEAGHKVAICEQVEDPALAKGIVKREVVSVLTKGTWSENPLLDRSINSFLAVVMYNQPEIVIVFADVSTGDIILRSSTDSHPIAFLSDELMRYQAVESLFTKDFFEEFSLSEELKIHQETLRVLPKEYFSESNLFTQYKLNNAKYFEDLSSTKLSALAGLFHYLEENHFTEASIKHFHSPFEYHTQDTLVMNEDTMKHLELTSNAKDNSNQGTLFSILNRCRTMPGARKLRRLIVAPSARLEDILRQQSRTEYFVNLSGNTVSELLKGISDLERLAARLATGKILPRECLALAESIQRSEKLKHFLVGAAPFHEYLAGLHSLEEFCKLVESTLNQDSSNSLDGNTLREGIDEELDSYKKLLENGKNYLLTLQAEERINTGISTLKIAYNKIYGYYIEVSKVGAQKAPEHYKRKQSLVNAERFTIPELEQFEQKHNQAESMVLRLERDLYEKFIIQLQQYYNKLMPLIDFVSEVDLRNSLSTVAKTNRYQKPKLNNSFDWTIKEGRHPVIEMLLQKDSFVSNDTTINRKESRVSIVTGPNMAGKSTYLRQNALFAVMAQIGSFLPVDSAEIGIVDQIFTRIGASDDLGAGRSTFFVEMEEAALILDRMTSSSLVIMDELGRGTSTQDGLALSWAILEYMLLHPKKQGKILFSTHYHELTELSSFNSVINLCMAIKENKGKPIFLRKVIKGKASKSYGIHVAEMAGVDSSIIKRAEAILEQLEKGIFFKTKKSSSSEQDLFKAPIQEDSLVKEKLYQIIKKVDPNALTPLEALRVIYELKNIEREDEVKD